MASWQARAVSAFLKFAIKRPLRRSPTAATIRRVFNAQTPHVSRSCDAQTSTVAGVPGEWVRSKQAAPLGTLLYIHGGAFVGCSPITHRPVTNYFAKRGWNVFAPDYRLAPEHPFPAAVEDVLAVYRGLLDSGIAPAQLAVAGDSAGGNLALVLAMSLKAAGLPQPSALVLFSPVTDLMWTGASIQENSRSCAMFTKEILPAGTDLYVAGADARNPRISPFYGDPTGLPPLLFHVGEQEILRDDSLRMAERARQAGVSVELRTWPAVPHVWQMVHAWIPEGRESLDLAHQFLRRHVNGTARSA